MDAEECIRPSVGRVTLAATAIVTAWYLLEAGFTLYAVYFWPQHAILQNTASEWVRGLLLQGVFLGALFTVAYLVERRKGWRICSTGITILCNHKERRFVSWTDEDSVLILPFGLALRLRSVERAEWLHWIRPGAAIKVREAHRKHMDGEHRT